MPIPLWLTALFHAIGHFFSRKDRELVEPVLDGFEGLTVSQSNFIEQLENRQLIIEKALAESIRDRTEIKRKLGKAIGHLKREAKKQQDEITECNRDRKRLQERVESLEQNAKTDKDYSHDHAHFFENFIKFLKTDLEAAGIEPKACASVIREVERREAERQRERRERSQGK